MSWLAELLPLWFVRWYSDEHCERFNIGHHIMTCPRPGVFICASECKQNHPK